MEMASLAIFGAGDAAKSHAGAAQDISPITALWR